VAESFFSNLKSEKIKKSIYYTREEARSEVFSYVEGFSNRVRRNKHLDQLSPHECERQRQTAPSKVSAGFGEYQITACTNNLDSEWPQTHFTDRYTVTYFVLKSAAQIRTRVQVENFRARMQQRVYG